MRADKSGGVHPVAKRTAVTSGPARPRRTHGVIPDVGPGLSAAVLLIGPTGSGKTPLGILLERRGLWGRRCLHFDFGAEMRRIAAAHRPPRIFSPRDIAVIRRVLSTGALLDDGQFVIAMKTLACFLSRKRLRQDDLLVLNGLPRHVGQASRISRVLAIGLVVRLECSNRTVVRRIAGNAGGDRTCRVDDDKTAIAARLAEFGKRTVPLVRYYRQKRTPVRCLRVGIDTRPEDIWRRLQDLGEPQ